MKPARNKQKILCLIVFTIYILVLLKLTIFRPDVFYEERQLNATLFVDLMRMYRNAGLGYFLWLFLGNIGWFVPFGFLLPVLLKAKGFFTTVTLGVLLSLMIESIQFFSHRGVAELDDLILNTAGVVIGYCLLKITARVCRNNNLNAPS